MCCGRPGEFDASTTHDMDTSATTSDLIDWSESIRRAETTRRQAPKTRLYNTSLSNANQKFIHVVPAKQTWSLIQAAAETSSLYN